jgi:hypothetical protein
MSASGNHELVIERLNQVTSAGNAKQRVGDLGTRACGSTRACRQHGRQPACLQT